MHPADIQAELKKNDVTQASIAQDLGVSPFHVSAVIHYPTVRQSDRVMRAVAKAIRRDHREVFPSYYFNLKRRSREAA